jgi:hypothetical protein
MACLMPMLCATKNLMKFTQSNDIYICDYLVAVKTLEEKCFKWQI